MDYLNPRLSSLSCCSIVGLYVACVIFACYSCSYIIVGLLFHFWTIAYMCDFEMFMGK